MNEHANRQAGFAMIMVLMLLATAAVLGYSYVSSTTVKIISTDNLAKAVQAEYMAESGLQHALYILQSNPGLLEGTESAPLGPFYVDGGENSYRIYAVADPDVPGKYYVTAEGTVREVTRRTSITVQSSTTAQTKITHGLLIGGAGVFLPSDLRINGDVHSNGAFFINFARIDGDVSCVGAVWDPFGWISGEVLEGVESIDMPDIGTDQYKTYELGGSTSTAIQKVTDALGARDKLNNGGSITADNVGGVIWLKSKRPNRPVKIKRNVEFQGTIIVEGDVLLDGRNISLTAQEGFPAIVTTGRLLIARGAEAKIEGVVVAAGGIAGEDGKARFSRTEITGGLVSDWVGYSSDLRGRHKLTYDQDKATLYDFSGEGTSQGGSLEIISYD